MLETAARTAAHVTAELKADVDEIMGTISDGDVLWVQFFQHGSAVINDPEAEILLRVMTDHDGARAYYEKFVAEMIDLHKVVHVRDVLTEWFAFYESIIYGTDLRTGKDVRIRHVVLFHVRGSGVAGEVIFPQTICRRGLGAEADVSTDALLERAGDLLEHILDAFRRGDAETIATAYREDVYLGLRDFTSPGGSAVMGTSRQDVRAYYERIFRDFDVVSATVLNRVCEGWYVFAELLLVLRSRSTGASVRARSANVFGVGPAGEIVGQVSIRTDLIGD
jgi:ketosteroid isomerase-like protein